MMASCGFQDPDHSYEGGRIQLNGGRCNGWLRSGRNDSLSIGYYEQRRPGLPGPAAADWTTFDRYFSAVMAETYPNRFYLHGARTDRLHNNTTLFTYPTIWSRLIAKRVSNAYYHGDTFSLFPILLKHFRFRLYSDAFASASTRTNGTSSVSSRRSSPTGLSATSCRPTDLRSRQGRAAHARRANSGHFCEMIARCLMSPLALRPMSSRRLANCSLLPPVSLRLCTRLEAASLSCGFIFRIFPRGRSWGSCRVIC